MTSTLTISRRFIEDFMEQDAPCFALAMIEERGRLFAALVFNPGVALPDGISADGFELGHSVLGGANYEILHFAFGFHGFATYNVLLNPSNALVQSVVRSMVERGGYFILAVSPELRATAFRADFGKHDLQGFRDHYQRILHSTTSDACYRKANTQFRRRPSPSGHVLNWVCRDDEKYLEPASDPLELTQSVAAATDSAHGPDADRSSQDAPRPNWQPLSMLPTIRMIVDGELESNEAVLALLQAARERPQMLDGETIERAIRMCNGQMEFVPIYREQLARWREASPSAAQRNGIERLALQLDRHVQVLDELLMLTRELQGDTIDAIMRMGDAELALAVLTGRIKPPR